MSLCVLYSVPTCKEKMFASLECSPIVSIVCMDEQYFAQVAFCVVLVCALSLQ